MDFVIKKFESLKEKTSIRIGGRARFYFEVFNERGLEEVIHFSRTSDMLVFVIGNGTNVIFPDEDLDLIVIKLKGEFEKFSMKDQRIIVGGGANLIQIGWRLILKGYSDYKFMCLIPGTVGGGIVTNAGTPKTGSISDVIRKVSVFDLKTMSIYELKNNELEFSYRNSLLNKEKGRYVILKAEFDLGKKENPFDLKKEVLSLLEQRRKKQPKCKLNCGSVFKNPSLHEPAAFYIEKAGFKGFRIGDIQVSREHANWIVNLGGGKAKDFKKLVEIIREEVNIKFGVLLEREVIYVPEDIIR